MRRWVMILCAVAVAAAVLYLPASKRLSLLRLEHANALADADKAVARGDLRLVAVHLFRIQVPGADSTLLGGPALERCAVRRIGPYASDAMSAFQEQYNGAALGYALAYNRRLLSKAGRCTPPAAA